MIARKDIDRLAQVHSDDGVLTVCLKIDPRLGYDRHQAAAKFKGSLSRFARTADEPALAALERERPRVLSYLESWKPHGRALVIYSCTPTGLWEVFELEVLLPSFVAVDTSPQTAMLARVLDEYPRMAVVLLNGGDGRIYVGEQRTDEPRARVDTELPSRHDQGGWSQARFQRHVEEHHLRHLKEVAERLEELYYAQPFSRLVLVGVDEAVDDFKGYLSAPVALRLAGSFSVDFKTQNDNAILERAGSLVQDEERSAEMALVQQIGDQAAAGGQGVLGVADTLRALVEQKVQILAVAEGLEQGGSACANCGYLAAQELKSCPVCGGAPDRVPDVIDHAVERALAEGADVNTVFEDAREELMAKGGIGALLRY